MSIYFEEIIKQTQGNNDILDITTEVADIINKSDIKNGIVTVFAIGSTAAITTIEFEPGLKKDLPEFLNKIIPQYKNYYHDNTWGDGNGYAHLRSALLKTGITVPFVNSQMTLGQYQQIIFIDFDNRIRSRHIAVQIIGE